MKLTHYSKLLAPTKWSVKDGPITNIIPKHISQRSKDGALFSPAMLQPGGKRQDKDVLTIEFGVLDLDGVPEEHLLRYLSFDHQFLLFSTYNHCNPDDPDKVLGAWRVVVPFDRPATPSEWPQVWAALNADFGGRASDGQCKSLSHAYYYPACPAERASLARYDWNEGQVWSVDEALRRPSVALGRPAATGAATLTLERLRKAVSCQKKHMASRFAALLAGEGFAKPGERNVTGFQMMRDLARALPEIDPASLAPFLHPAVDGMEPDDGFNVDILIEQFRKGQDEAVASATAAAQDDCARAFYSTSQRGRVEPYTDAEIQAWTHGIERLWVLQQKHSFWVLLDGKYVGPIHQSELSDIALLAPASSAGVERFKATRNGPVLKEWPDLALEYGTRVEQVIVDLSLKHSRFDPDARVLYEAPCPVRQVVPTWSDEIDGWLRLFAGEQYEKLQAWLASCTDVGTPTAVLFIKAIRGVGKSLFMGALAHLWLKDHRDSAPELIDSMNTEFNEGLTKCPLTVADENFPPNKSAELRRFMQARSHTLRRKFMPNALVVGAPRVVIAANNKHMLRMREILTADDVDAIGERILYLEPSDEARDYLLRHNPPKWVEDDIFTAHVAFLRETHRFVKGGRFLVEGESKSFHRSLAVSTALSSAICEYVARYLRDPNRAAQCTVPVLQMRDKDILVSPSGLGQYWDLYTTNFRPAPELRDISTALQAITMKGREVVKVKGKATHFRVVDRKMLEQWANDNDWGDLE